MISSLSTDDTRFCYKNPSIATGSLCTSVYRGKKARSPDALNNRTEKRPTYLDSFPIGPENSLATAVAFYTRLARYIRDTPSLLDKMEAEAYSKARVVAVDLCTLGRKCTLAAVEALDRASCRVLPPLAASQDRRQTPVCAPGWDA